MQEVAGRQTRRIVENVKVRNALRELMDRAPDKDEEVEKKPESRIKIEEGVYVVVRRAKPAP